MPHQPRSPRLGELERRFVALAERIADSPEKEALSVLHGMLQEAIRAFPRQAQDSIASEAPVRNGIGSANGTSEHRNGALPTFESIADLYKSAPGMSGRAMHEPLPVGTPAPPFTLHDAHDRDVSLEDFRGRPVVIVFYPLDWSPTCSDQLSLYQSDIEDFDRRGAAIVAISVDSIYSHGAWSAVRGLSFPLLADFEPKGDVARRYNVYRDADGFSERALYVVDGDGIIRHAEVAEQLDHIPDIYRLLDVLDRVDASNPAAAR